MCGNADLTVEFLPVDAAGNFNIAHPALVIGGMVVSGGITAMSPMKVNTFFQRPGNDRMHQGWLAKAYNSMHYAQRSNTQEYDDGLLVATTANVVPGNIFPIHLFKYIPFNAFLEEKAYPVTDFFVNTTGLKWVVVAQCKRKP